MTKTLLDIQKIRRTQYQIGKDVSLSKDEIAELVSQTLLEIPSAFNSRTQEVVLLFGEEHDALWDITLETLRELTGGENFEGTAAKIASFKAGFGSILFYTDTRVTKGLEEQFPLYAANFAPWAQQENGMVQYAMWMALAEKGIGASLQHYNPLIDEALRARWGIPETSTLLAQMPFGHIVQGADAPAKPKLEDKFKRFG